MSDTLRLNLSVKEDEEKLLDLMSISHLERCKFVTIVDFAIYSKKGKGRRWKKLDNVYFKKED